ncbi:protein takeout [Anabrus simplex]|uniref:protein takeout n=1 Tax=Anabrus simplex TaxID=316456 RepID=UPI0035A3A007
MAVARYLLLIIAVLSPVALEAKSKAKNVGDYFTLCSRSDPNLGECIKNSMTKAKPKLIEGIPELQLVPLEPLHIPLLEFKDGQGNFEFHMTLRNLIVRGLKDFDVKDCKMDIDKGHLDMDIVTPQMNFEAQYEVDGKILVVPIQGNGDVVFNFTGVRTIASIRTKTIQKDGQEYRPIEDLKWTIEVDKGQSHFTNLFNGDKTLGDATNKFLNENHKEAFETLKSLPEEAFGQFFKEMGNKIFAQYPIDELFLK